MCWKIVKCSSVENRAAVHFILLSPLPTATHHPDSHVSTQSGRSVRFACISKGFTWAKFYFSFNVEQQRNDPCSLSFIYVGSRLALHVYKSTAATTVATAAATTFIFRVFFLICFTLLLYSYAIHIHVSYISIQFFLFRKRMHTDTAMERNFAENFNYNFNFNFKLHAHTHTHHAVSFSFFINNIWLAQQQEHVNKNGILCIAFVFYSAMHITAGFTR